MIFFAHRPSGEVFSHCRFCLSKFRGQYLSTLWRRLLLFFLFHLLVTFQFFVTLCSLHIVRHVKYSLIVVFTYISSRSILVYPGRHRLLLFLLFPCFSHSSNLFFLWCSLHIVAYRPSREAFSNCRYYSHKFHGQYLCALKAPVIVPHSLALHVLVTSKKNLSLLSEK